MTLLLIYINPGYMGCFQLNPSKDIIPLLSTSFSQTSNLKKKMRMNFSPLVKNTEIELSTRTIGKTLHIPYHGLTLNEIHMDDDEVLSRIFLPGQGPSMTNNKLQPIPRLIGRILPYNICPKMGSFNYFSRELSACVYVIMIRLEVNWAQIIFDNLVKEHTTFIPYGAYLTHLQEIQS